MKKLESIFGFDVNLDDEGNVVINDMCNYPQINQQCFSFFQQLELIKIDESKITFPTQLKEWGVIISPTDKETITEYFKIDGIKKVVEKKNQTLLGKLPLLSRRFIIRQSQNIQTLLFIFINLLMKVVFYLMMLMI